MIEIILFVLMIIYLGIYVYNYWFFDENTDLSAKTFIYSLLIILIYVVSEILTNMPSNYIYFIFIIETVIFLAYKIKKGELIGKYNFRKR